MGRDHGNEKAFYLLGFVSGTADRGVSNRHVLHPFRTLEHDSSLLDYLLFFVAGTLGGLILLFFLNRQTSNTSWWIVLGFFVVASPVAMFFVLGGGLLGPLGVLIFPQIPWVLFTWIGSLAGRWVAR